METGNTRFLDKTENRKFYDTSDGVFMPEQNVLQCHLYLERIAWAREHIHNLGLKTIIDIGPKDCYFPLQLTDEGKEVTAIEPSKDASERGLKLAEYFGLQLNIMNCYWEDYDLSEDIVIQEDKKYDAAVCLEVIEHVLDPELFTAKLASAGKYVFISTPDYYGRHGIEDAKRNEAHVRLYTKEELENLLKQYGEIVDSQIIDDQICICINTK